MSLVTGAWRWMWFEHGSARNVAAARIIVSAQALWVVASRDYAAMSGLPAPFWDALSPATAWRFLVFPGHPVGEALLQWIAIGALLMALVGIYPRPACLVAGLLLYHLAPLETLIWTPHAAIRGLTITVLCLVTLSFSRCGDAFSLMRRRAEGNGGSSALDYSWQLRLVQVFLAQVYLFSFWGKVKQSGLAWADGENIRRWFLYQAQQPEFSVFHKPGLWIAEHPVLCAAIGVGTLAFEGAFISVLGWRIARRILVPLAILFHLGIAWTMNLTFPAMPLLLVFVNWDWVWARGKALLASRPSPPGDGPNADAVSR